MLKDTIKDSFIRSETNSNSEIFYRLSVDLRHEFFPEYYSKDQYNTYHLLMQDDMEKIQGHFEYIPLSIGQFKRIIGQITKKFPNNRKFIDVGSGLGEKVLLAHWLKFDASGIEYNQATFEYSKKVFPDFNLIQGNAKIFNFKDFNFIYSYCPIHNRRSYWELGLNILRTMPVGGIWIETYAMCWESPRKFMPKNVRNLFKPDCPTCEEVVIHKLAKNIFELVEI